MTIEDFNQYITTNYSPEKQRLVFDMFKGLIAFQKAIEGLSKEEMTEVWATLEKATR